MRRNRIKLRTFKYLNHGRNWLKWSIKCNTEEIVVLLFKKIERKSKCVNWITTKTWENEITLVILSLQPVNFEPSPNIIQVSFVPAHSILNVLIFTHFTPAPSTTYLLWQFWITHMWAIEIKKALTVIWLSLQLRKQAIHF